MEGGQSLLGAQEEASLADNALCGVRGSFSGAELEIFSFADPSYVCSMTEGWLFCTSASLQVVIGNALQRQKCFETRAVLDATQVRQQGEKEVKLYSWIPIPWHAKRLQTSLCCDSGR